MKSLIMLFSLMISVSSFAQKKGVHVGNGGGEGEMKALEYFKSLPSWITFCKVNINTCSKSGSVLQLSQIENVLKKYKLTTLKFVNSDVYTSEEVKTALDKGFLLVTHASLYVDNVKVKSNESILNLILNQLYILDNKIDITFFNFYSFEIFVHPNLVTTAVVINNSRYIFYSQSGVDLQSVLSSYGAKIYRVAADTHDGYIVLVDDQVYLKVSFLEDENGIKTSIENGGPTDYFE